MHLNFFLTCFISNWFVSDVLQILDMRGIRREAQELARSRPPSTLLSQDFSVGRHAVSHTVEVVGHPVNMAKLLPGMNVVQVS